MKCIKEKKQTSHLKKRFLAISLCTAFMFLFSFQLDAQTGLQAEGIAKFKQTTQSSLVQPILLTTPTTTSLPPSIINQAPQQSVLKMPKAYNFEDLAFFCKIEVQLDQQTAMPVRFRLGTVNYVDRLEGKLRPY